ncbi:hypothetical protein N7457_006303 [Penicillium paradoxum]|uniref:uncharacterized protein n=1 Tax=Penicillium paradoxum TaxID=176176 RepID=UPI0025490A5B|nr:uncharacterized protein N7457_006303 [Penicillium paradoxum]KAJ5781143.1 hypothetical protein N7457_006303 [Penicillium paradoxum]
MYFSYKTIAVMASLMTLGLAADPLSFTSWPKDPLEAGKPVTLTWTGAAEDKPVIILLRQGSSGNLKDMKAITDQGKDGSFTWTPDSDIKEGQTYAFQITQGDQTNYTALLKSGGKPMVDEPKENETIPSTGTTTGGTTTTAGTTTAGTTTADTTTTGTTTAGTTTADTTTGTDTTPPPNTQTTEQSTQTTPTPPTTLTSTGSKALIGSSAPPSGSPSGSPSRSASATSTETSGPTGTEIINHKEASATDGAQSGAVSTATYSVQLVMGVVGLLAYLV